MDKISFNIVNRGQLENSNISVLNVIISINEEFFDKKLLNLEAVLPLYNFSSAKFDLFTCECGVPGCAGFHSEVIQEIKNKYVYWIFPDSGEYGTKKTTYKFDLIDFELELRGLYDKLLKLESQGVYFESNVSDESNYIGSDEEECYSIKSSIKEVYNWYYEQYSAKQKFFDFINSSKNIYKNKKISLSYDGKIIKKGILIEEIVGKLLNQYPDVDCIEYYLKLVALCIKAINRMVVSKDNKLIKRILRHGYGKYNLNEYYAFDEYLYNVVSDDGFEIDNLGFHVS